MYKVPEHYYFGRWAHQIPVFPDRVATHLFEMESVIAIGEGTERVADAATSIRWSLSLNTSDWRQSVSGFSRLRSVQAGSTTQLAPPINETPKGHS